MALAESAAEYDEALRAATATYESVFRDAGEELAIESSENPEQRRLEQASSPLPGTSN
jgi:hypothetical protein